MGIGADCCLEVLAPGVEWMALKLCASFDVGRVDEGDCLSAAVPDGESRGSFEAGLVCIFDGPVD